MESDILTLSISTLNLIWLGLFIILIVIELFTVGLTTIWFAIGSLAAMAANRNRLKTNYESKIGEIIQITERVDNLKQTGKSIVDGQEWTVRSQNNSEILEEGDLAKIISVSGVKLIVKKYEEGLS